MGTNSSLFWISGNEYALNFILSIIKLFVNNLYFLFFMFIKVQIVIYLFNCIFVSKFLSNINIVLQSTVILHAILINMNVVIQRKCISWIVYFLMINFLFKGFLSVCLVHFWIVQQKRKLKYYSSLYIYIHTDTHIPQLRELCRF